MFQGLRTGGLFYVLEKGDELKLKIGHVVSVSNPQPKYNQMSTIPSSTLRDLINCRINNPSSFVIYQICKALNISLEEFFNNELFNFNNLED